MEGAAEDGSTRSRLVTAAFEEFEEHGYLGARVQRIAERAGVTTGAIYAHFSGKAELFTAAVDLVRGPMSGVSPDDPALPPSRRIAMFVEPVVNGGPQPVDRMLVEAWSAISADPVLKDANARRRDAYLELIRARLAGIDDDHVDLVITITRALSLGATTIRAMGETIDEPRLLDVLDAMVDAILRTDLG